MCDELVVPQSTDVDTSVLADHARLLAFDLDNTLARSKMPMSDETTHLFASLTHILPVAIVTGGRYELIESQVLDAIFDYAHKENLVLLPTTGSAYYQWNGHRFERIYNIELSHEQKLHASEAIKLCAQDLGLWFDDIDGTHIEDRGSQITFSALGSRAHADIKEKWDPRGKLRAPLAERLQKLLPELNVRIAGTTSIDVSHKGLDKAYAVRQLARLHTIDVHDIVFVGDRMMPGGNDYPAALAGTMAVSVEGPDDTNMWMKQFMEKYTRGLRIDIVSRKLWIYGREITISDSEFSLLLALMHAQGKVISREKLMQDAWKYAPSGDTRLLSVSIARLRSILEDNSHMPRRIVTVRGGGYRFSYD
ncbi:HAD-IIB family hydrolase [Alloscardovia theropitheci]|uniref:phosphomannomutase n=1 Tax=Alloscardovia theropitheci TaxID=2496842 RepID=A0A4V2MU16_9BIFI|nr:HAD-IIB family hydrolase [Alloscardovia theropitheci]TCD54609.1 HAD-IIB family hydrolase [Alloscardovia theropitheci]